MTSSFRTKAQNILRLQLMASFAFLSLAVFTGQVWMNVIGFHFLFPGLGMLYSSQDVFQALFFTFCATTAFFISAGIWLAMGQWILLCLVWTGLLLAAILTGEGVNWLDVSPLWLLPLAAAIPLIGFSSLRDKKTSPPPFANYNRFAPLNVECASNEQMNFFRYRANQTVSEYDGFLDIEPFQTSALRYQISFMAYALALSAARSGYDFQIEQKNLIEKQCQRKVWKYWRLENLWGNGANCANPLTTQNIMYRGFLGLQIELYHKTTGRNDYDEQNALQLDGENMMFQSDQHALIKGLVHDYQRAPFGLLACEPNWVYPICNMITACAIKSYDERCGTSYWADIAPRFFSALERDFLRSNGRFWPARSERLGLAIPSIATNTTEAFSCLFLNAIAPRQAHEHWCRLRTDILRKSIFWTMSPVDIGNYHFSYASSLTTIAAAAAEMNDQDVLDFTLRELETRYPKDMARDIVYRPKMSIWAHNLECMARQNGGDGLRTLILKGSKNGML